MWTYSDSRAAVRDALRLSRAMTFKSAVAGLPLGGGKGVIMLPAGTAPPTGDDRRALLLDFGETVQTLDGAYLTAEDVGTSEPDMQVISEATPFVTGLATERGGSGDPSPWTALGVEAAIRVACERVFGSPSLEGRSVAVVGVGSVGGRLAELLAAGGADLVLADIDDRRRELADRLGARWTDPQSAFTADVDVLPRAPSAPCSTRTPSRSCAAARSPARRTTSSRTTTSGRCSPRATSSGSPISSPTPAAWSTSPSSSSRRATRSSAPRRACVRSPTRSARCSTTPTPREPRRSRPRWRSPTAASPRPRRRRAPA